MLCVVYHFGMRKNLTEFPERFAAFQSGDLSERMQMWPPEMKKAFYIRLLGVINNARRLRNGRNSAGEQMTARLLAEVITIAMRDDDYVVAEMIPRITGLGLSLDFDQDFWKRDDAGEELEKLCRERLKTIDEYVSFFRDSDSGSSIGFIIRDIFRKVTARLKFC